MTNTMIQIPDTKWNDGFTLVELMITVVISMVIGLSLLSAYQFQQRSQVTQDQVVEMQQNIRSVFHFMTREMRMAGFDPQQTSGAGIVTATNSRFQFTQDINTPGAGVIEPGNGDTLDPNENITYGFSNANDADFDGIADAGAAPIGRNTGGGFTPLANNIAAIEFLYTLESGATTTNPAGTELDNIRKVTVSLLARARVPDPAFVSSQAYVTASGAIWPAANDNFRRRLLISDITLRNMGL